LLGVTKQELIDEIADQSGLDRQDAAAALEAALVVVTTTLAQGGEVTLTGFGKFHTAVRGARQGVNPRTGEAMQIGASTVPRFTAGSALKKAVKQ
jgi:DNA-binding protein HU-beta